MLENSLKTIQEDGGGQPCLQQEIQGTGAFFEKGPPKSKVCSIRESKYIKFSKSWSWNQKKLDLPVNKLVIGRIVLDIVQFRWNSIENNTFKDSENFRF